MDMVCRYLKQDRLPQGGGGRAYRGEFRRSPNEREYREVFPGFSLRSGKRSKENIYRVFCYGYLHIMR